MANDDSSLWQSGMIWLILSRGCEPISLLNKILGPLGANVKNIYRVGYIGSQLIKTGESYLRGCPTLYRGPEITQLADKQMFPHLNIRTQRLYVNSFSVS